MFLFIFPLLLVLVDQSVAQTVVTTNVGKIAGLQKHIEISGRRTVVTEFLGIPYAEDTSGQNRFKKPIPKAPFNDTFNAFTVSPPCMQASVLAADNKNMTEDCLMLNIFVPREFNSTMADKLPVMIWIHGGAFISGSAKGYDGNPLGIVGDVVVVTINYRLAEFGFLNVGDARASGNQGLWDQHLAFRWVKSNIRAFMGDPDEITIFGESAGGISVIFHSLYAANKGLFKRAIAQSGSALAYHAIHPPYHLDRFFELAGCNGSQDEVECLRQKSSDDIIRVLSRPEMYGCCSNTPTLDHDFLVEMPHDIIFGNNTVSFEARQFYRSLDMLTGVTNGDGNLFFLITWIRQLLQLDLNNLQVTVSDYSNKIAPYIISAVIHPSDNNSYEALKMAIMFEYIDWTDPNNNDLLRQSLLQLSSDTGFFVPALETIKAHSSSPLGHSYFFIFSAEPPARLVPTPNWFKGASHADDVQYVFGAQLLDFKVFQDAFHFVPTTRNGTLTKADINLSLGMMTAWSNFAKSGNPNTPVDVTQFFNTTWPEYDLMNQQYLDFSMDMSPSSVKQHFSARALDFWTKLIPAILRDTTRRQPDQRPSPLDIIVVK